MNKAVPWSVKGVGFDAREVAYMAARRAGVPIGEWLNSVITDRAHELGVSADEFTADDRVDALVARLAGVAESAPHAEGYEEVRAASARKRAPATRLAGAPSMSHHSVEDDSEARDEAARLVRRVANGADAFDWPPARNVEREPVRTGARRASLAEWDDDMLLDQALEMVEKRASAAGDQMSNERQRLTVAALAKEVELMSRADLAVDRRPPVGRDAPRPARRAEGSRPIREAVGSVAERIGEIESRIAHRDADLANRPIVAALSRLEDRFEHLMRRNAEGARENVRVESTFRDIDSRLRDITQRLERNEHPLPARSVADVERMDGNLAAVLAKLDAPPPERDSWDEGAQPLRTGRKAHRDTIAEIARRQADLDQAEHNRSSLLRGTSYASIDQAQRETPNRDAEDRVASPPRRPAAEERVAAPPAHDPFDSFSGLQDAFAQLTERMEAKLEQAAKASVATSDLWSDDIGALKTGIAALADRLDTLKQRNDEEPARRGERDDLDLLRHEIAALQAGLAKLAPQSAIATLEEAVRDLGGRIEASRQVGVEDAVLEPLERLRREVREVLGEHDLRGTIGGVEQQLQAIGTRIEGIEAQNVDRDLLQTMQDQTQEVRDLLRSAANQFQAAERLEHEIGHLGQQVERLVEVPPRSAVRDLELAVNEIRTMLVQFSPDSAIQDVSRKLDVFADRMDQIENHVAAPAVMFDEFSRRIDKAHAALAERLVRVAPQSVDLGPLEHMIEGLSGKIDGLSHASSDVKALGGLVRGLAAQIEDARTPNADARTIDALETQVGRLAERLDRSDDSLEAITSVERLIRDLFHQIDETRTATIDAAETAARNAAQETLRAALVNPAIAGEEASSRATRVVEQVGQELAEFRKAQQVSEKRVHSTLLALNDTLERMVDRMVVGTPAASAPAPAPAPAVADAAPAASGARPSQPKVAPEDLIAAAVVAKPLQAARSPEKVADDAAADAVKLTPAVKAPAVEIGRPALVMPMPDVSPLIAAARRAAQAAQASAVAAGRESDVKSRVAPTAAEQRSGPAWRTMFRHKRPMLLSIASVVLLLGALQIVRLSQPGHETGVGDSQDATASIAPEARQDATVAEATPSPSAVTAAPGPQASASLLSGAPVKPDAGPAPATTTSFTPLDPAPKALPASLRELADRGDPAAQHEVGSRLAEGRGVPRDVKSAAPWFERAAKQGYGPAEYRLGALYEKGIGVAAEPNTAVSWYEKAATQGNVRAMHNLAVMAAEGSAGKPDYVRAASWFTKAAEHGVRDSQYNLAILYARGLGVTQDLAQSYTWFAVAAAQGDIDAGKKRDDVAAKLDAAKLTSAKSAADTFKPQANDRAANDVTPPPGGWDVASSAKAATPSARLSSM